MKKVLFTLSLVIAIFTGYYGRAQKIPSYNSEQLLARVASSDTVYIVNFWATWCVPCVKELPSFRILNDLYKDRPVKVLLVSFDFKEQYPDKLESWVSKKKLRPEVVWFSETNPTDYIPKIAPEWEGGLPATLLINNKTGERKLIANEISVDVLKTWIDQQL